MNKAPGQLLRRFCSDPQVDSRRSVGNPYIMMMIRHFTNAVFRTA